MSHRALLAALLLVGVSGVAAAQPAVAIPPASKKAEYLAAKQAPAAAAKPAKAKVSPRKVGAPPPKVISVYNTWTHEWIALDADTKAGLPAETTVNRFLRCHFTNQPTKMDGTLARALREAARHFGRDRIDIVSGFRAPKYNLMLRKKGRQVARDSQHSHGNAVDFRIPGVDVRAVEAWARRLRLGGVGLYLGSGFVHVDTGRVRYWNGT
ncbi:MAG: DUF882 domain-containing protein [Deltaproteobacteria bacterium]|nr:DUF882 domain-containing protein [Kofleriaceae bacterium]